MPKCNACSIVVILQAQPVYIQDICASLPLNIEWTNENGVFADEIHVQKATKCAAGKNLSSCFQPVVHRFISFSVYIPSKLVYNSIQGEKHGLCSEVV